MFEWESYDEYFLKGSSWTKNANNVEEIIDIFNRMNDEEKFETMIRQYKELKDKECRRSIQDKTINIEEIERNGYWDMNRFKEMIALVLFGKECRRCKKRDKEKHWMNEKGDWKCIPKTGIERINESIDEYDRKCDRIMRKHQDSIDRC